MQRSRALLYLSGLALLALVASEALGAAKPVKFTKQWKGSVADEGLQKKAPHFITNADAFKKLWKAWGIKDELPKVDFRKEIVVIATTRGSRLALSARLDDLGNLQVLGLGTRDLRPGFRYVMGSMPRKGIKAVNGQKIKKD
jgi:hypothetical protein